MARVRRCPIGASLLILLLLAAGRSQGSEIGGSIEGRITAGSEGYLEKSFAAEIDIGEYAGVKGAAWFSDRDDADAAEHYLAGGEVRFPVGLTAGGGVTHSPSADGLESDSFFAWLEFKFDTPGLAAGFQTAVRCGGEHRTYSIAGVSDIDQDALAVRLEQTLYDRWIASVEYWDYAYDPNPDTLLEPAPEDPQPGPGQRRQQNRPINRSIFLLGAASYLATLPDWMIRSGLEAFPTRKIRLGFWYDLIQPELDEVDERESNFAAEIGYLFFGRLEVAVGAALYDSSTGTDWYGSGGLTFLF